MSFDFYKSCGSNGVVKYFPDNDEADELLVFLGIEKMYVDDNHMDKIYNWLSKMGHECYVENQPQRKAKKEIKFEQRRHLAYV